MKKSAKVWVLRLSLATIAVAGIAGYGFMSLLSLTKPSKAVLVKVKKGDGLTALLAELETKGVIKSSSATGIFVRLKGPNPSLKPGTYNVKPGSTWPQIVAQLGEPYFISVRIPEGWWIKRIAERLEKEGVVSAADYIDAANNGADTAKGLGYPFPEGSLEGYLYPATYQFEPGVSAKEIVQRQLKAFVTSVAPLIKDPAKTHKVLTVASMVELEVAKDHERPKVAGIIENRLRIGMPLQIDATVLYGMQEWKVLGPGQVRKVDSPYNTYLIKGLPPGPIGSPGKKSVEAALRPATLNSLYYVALPDKTHLFSESYSGHLANIRKARAQARP